MNKPKTPSLPTPGPMPVMETLEKGRMGLEDETKRLQRLAVASKTDFTGGMFMRPLNTGLKTALGGWK